MLTRYQCGILFSLLFCCLPLVLPQVVSFSMMACSPTYNFLNKLPPLLNGNPSRANLLSLGHSCVSLFFYCLPHLSTRLACNLTYNFLSPHLFRTAIPSCVLTCYCLAILVSLSSCVVFLFSCHRWCPPPVSLCSPTYNFLSQPPASSKRQSPLELIA